MAEIPAWRSEQEKWRLRDPCPVCAKQTPAFLVLPSDPNIPCFMFLCYQVKTSYNMLIMTLDTYAWHFLGECLASNETCIAPYNDGCWTPVQDAAGDSTDHPHNHCEGPHPWQLPGFPRLWCAPERPRKCRGPSHLGVRAGRAGGDCVDHLCCCQVQVRVPSKGLPDRVNQPRVKKK